MKLWAMRYRATQDGRVIVESSDKTWSTGRGNCKPLQCSCLENPMNSVKRQKDMTPEGRYDIFPRLEEPGKLCLRVAVSTCLHLGLPQWWRSLELVHHICFVSSELTEGLSFPISAAVRQQQQLVLAKGQEAEVKHVASVPEVYLAVQDFQRLPGTASSAVAVCYVKEVPSHCPESRPD